MNISGGATQNKAKFGAVTRRQHEANRLPFDEWLKTLPGPDRPYDAQRDPALRPSVPSTREDRIALVEADKAEAPKWDFDVLCNKTRPLFDAKPFKDEWMQGKEAFERRLIKACFIDDMKFWRGHSWPNVQRRDWERETREAEAIRILEDLGVKRRAGYWAQLVEKPEPAVLSDEVVAGIRAEADALDELMPTVPPQQQPLAGVQAQPDQDALEAAADARNLIPRKLLDKLMADIEDGVNKPHAPDKHIDLALGCWLEFTPNDVRLRAPDCEKSVVVASRLDLKHKMEMASHLRGEVRELLVAVKQSVKAKRETGRPEASHTPQPIAAVMAGMVNPCAPVPGVKAPADMWGKDNWNVRTFGEKKVVCL